MSRGAPTALRRASGASRAPEQQEKLSSTATAGALGDFGFEIGWVRGTATAPRTPLILPTSGYLALGDLYFFCICLFFFEPRGGFLEGRAVPTGEKGVFPFFAFLRVFLVSLFSFSFFCSG
jgi:hypothetical protein